MTLINELNCAADYIFEEPLVFACLIYQTIKSETLNCVKEHIFFVLGQKEPAFQLTCKTVVIEIYQSSMKNVPCGKKKVKRKLKEKYSHHCKL